MLAESITCPEGRALKRLVDGLVLLLVIFATHIASPALAKGKYATLIESLDALQTRAAVAAAPQGNDQPLTPVVIHDSDLENKTAAYNEPSGLEEFAQQNSAPLNLEVSQRDQSLRKDLSMFGYDVFNRMPATFAPVEGLPVPQGYIIGPGDNLIVQLFGNRNVEYNLVVTRDGDILIPEYGPVRIAGLSFDEAEQLLTDGFERRVIGTRAVITMGKLRTIQVRVSGDVARPGIYTVGGLATFIDALLTTGGVAQTGSLRNIALIRNGRQIADIDLYQLLLEGTTDADPYLQHNDTIFVRPIGDVVYIGGEVLRPAIYELKSETTLGEILAMAGGTLHSASLSDSLLERANPSGRRVLIDFSNAPDRAAILAQTIRGGDFVRILPMEDELTDSVLLSGHVRRPGAYQYREGMRVSDLVPSIDTLLPGADTTIALIQREDPATLKTRVAYTPITTAGSRRSSNSSVELQRRDRVVIFDHAGDRSERLRDLVAQLRKEASVNHPARVFSAFGTVHYTGEFPLAEGARLLDALALAGGVREGADQHYGVIVRTQGPDNQRHVHRFSLAAARNNAASDQNPRILARDRIYLFATEQPRKSLLSNELEQLKQQAVFGDQEQTVSALGQVRFPGTYPLHQQMRASDLVCAAGGLASRAFSLTAELSRIEHVADGPSRAVHQPLDPTRLLSICRAQRQWQLGRLPRVEYRSLYLNESVNPVLTSMDQIAFKEKTGWVDRMSVVLSGEFTTPGTYVIDRGETLCSVVQRAGGVTRAAYVFGAFFTRQSVRDLQQQTIDDIKSELDDLMINLSLSHSYNMDSKSSHEWAGKQDYLRTIKQIEVAEASGRMVIDLENAMKCNPESDVVLENGDRLHVPVRPNHVHVAGQVYVPTSHLFQRNRRIADYIELSGGQTVLGELDHAYVIQANGEVLNLRARRNSSRIKRQKVSPGSRIYVPLNVDRMNGTEKAQTWVQTLINSALIAGIVI